MIDSIAEKVRAGERVSADEALELYRHAPTSLLGRLADAVRARKHPDADRHLHHRPQRQLHERLRGEVQLLRVLSPGRIRGRLRARLRRAVPEDRRDDRRRRRAAAAAGWSQPGPAVDVVRGPVPGDQGPISLVQAPRAVAAGSDPPVAPLTAAGSRGAAPPHRRRSSTASLAAARRSSSTACGSCCTVTARRPPTSGST